MIKTISVLITCHNRKEKTIACLQALYAQESLGTKFDLEVFLVDDGSTDGTSGAIRTQFPEVNIIQGDGNLYWNRGMHLAWETAAKAKAFDYYLWLNDDSFLQENAILVLLKCASNSQSRSIIIGSTCSFTNSSVTTYGGFTKNGQLINPADEMQLAYTFNGNVVLVPSSVFNQIGNLDPVFHHAIGDIEYGHRAIKNGLSSYVAPGFIAYCESHEKLPNWCLKSTPFVERIRSLYSPLGNSHPYYFFRYEFKYLGLYIALKHMFSIHLRLLFPALWNKKSN